MVGSADLSGDTTLLTEMNQVRGRSADTETEELEKLPTIAKKLKAM
jgi:hypothetical protein